MANTVGPVDEQMMAQFLRSGNINSPRNSHGHKSDIVAAALCASDPEITQALTAAALCYVVEHFEAFASEIDLPAESYKYSRLLMNSAAILMGNGAQAMREAFSE